MHVKLFGLKTCDTCRKAAKEFSKNGIEVTVRDVREDPLTSEELSVFIGAFGDALVNKRSTTWRNLDEAARTEPTETLLAKYPALMKRPVLESSRGLTLGWDAKAREVHL